MTGQPICKGSILLLSACQRCERCREERDDILRRLNNDVKAVTNGGRLLIVVNGTPMLEVVGTVKEII